MSYAGTVREVVDDFGNLLNGGKSTLATKAVTQANPYYQKAKEFGNTLGRANGKLAPGAYLGAGSVLVEAALSKDKNAFLDDPNVSFADKARVTGRDVFRNGLGAAGAVVGGGVGSVLGPLGTVVGGVSGAVGGHQAGDWLGEKVFGDPMKGYQAPVADADRGVKMATKGKINFDDPGVKRALAESNAALANPNQKFVNGQPVAPTPVAQSTKPAVIDPRTVPTKFVDRASAIPQNGDPFVARIRSTDGWTQGQAQEAQQRVKTANPEYDKYELSGGQLVNKATGVVGNASEQDINNFRQYQRSLLEAGGDGDLGITPQRQAQDTAFFNPVVANDARKVSLANAQTAGGGDMSQGDSYLQRADKIVNPVRYQQIAPGSLGKYTDSVNAMMPAVFDNMRQNKVNRYANDMADREHKIRGLDNAAAAASAKGEKTGADTWGNNKAAKLYEEELALTKVPAKGMFLDSDERKAWERRKAAVRQQGLALAQTDPRYAELLANIMAAEKLAEEE